MASKAPQVITLSGINGGGTEKIPLSENETLMVHGDTNLADLHELKSLEDFEGEGQDFAFEFLFRAHKDALKEMNKPGIAVRGMPAAVYHDHVLWTYQHLLAIEEVDEDEVKMKFCVLSVGPTFSGKEATPVGAFGNNCPRNQVVPPVKEAVLFLGDDTGIPLRPTANGFEAEEFLSVQQLKAMLGENPTADLKIRLVIRRSYFALSGIFDMEIEKNPANPQAEQILGKILAGEKPPGWDWVITVGDGQPREYFVHRRVLAHLSPILEAAIQSHRTVNQNHLLMVSHEDRFILPSLKAEDMKVFLSYAYLQNCVEPNFDAFARVGPALSVLLPQDCLPLFFAHWEQSMVHRLLKLDKKDTIATLKECARTLISVYSTPYGSLPIAKRVGVDVMADTWRMAELDGIDVNELIKDEPEFKFAVMERILHSVEKFRYAAAATKKRAI